MLTLNPVDLIAGDNAGVEHDHVLGSWLSLEFYKKAEYWLNYFLQSIKPANEGIQILRKLGEPHCFKM